MATQSRERHRGDEPAEPTVDQLSTAPEEVLELLGDVYARRILQCLAVESMAGQELADTTSMSTPTVYRRLDALKQVGLVDAEVVPNDDGHHYKRYWTTVEGVVVRFDTSDRSWRLQLGYDEADGGLDPTTGRPITNDRVELLLEQSSVIGVTETSSILNLFGDASTGGNGDPMSESRSSSHVFTPEPSVTSTDWPLREALIFIGESAFDAIGIEPLVSVWRDAGLETAETLACRRTGAVVQLEVKRPLDVDRLNDIVRVDWWEHVPNAGGGQRYVVEFAAPKFPSSLAQESEALISACESELNDDGITVSLVGPQPAISDVISEYEAAGLSPRLRSFGPYDGRDRPLNALTRRQREVVRTAYEMGYFEVPREVTSEEIASELAIGASTVSEHLQRAKQNLVTRDLSVEI